MGSGGPWRAVCNASKSTEMPANIHTHLNGAMGIAKGRQASITSTFRPIWQGRLLQRIPRDAHCRWVTSTEPLPADFHRYALGDCQSVASEMAVVSRSPSLSFCPPFNLHPCFPALLISILFFSPSSLYLLLSSTLSCSWLVVLAPVSGRANARISFRPMKSQSWQHAPVLTCTNVDVI